MTGLVHAEAAHTGVTLSPHELQLCGDLLGLDHLPVVLGRGPQSPDVESWTAAIAAARADLRGRGLLDAAGRVADSVADILDTVGRPAHEIAARRISAAGMGRLCLASGRRGGEVYAVRQPGERPDDADSVVTLGHTDSRAATLREFLGEQPPARLAPASARLRELQDGLAAAEGFAGCAQAVERAGIGAAQAGAIAEVLTAATAFTEIVAIVHESGQVSGTPAALVVYDSPAGRVVATPRRAPDGELWVTFGPGSWDRVARGLAALDELH